MRNELRYYKLHSQCVQQRGWKPRLQNEDGQRTNPEARLETPLTR